MNEKETGVQRSLVGPSTLTYACFRTVMMYRLERGNRHVRSTERVSFPTPIGISFL